MQFKRLRLYTSTPFQYNDQNSLDNPTFDTWGSFNDLAFRRAGHLVAEVPWDKLGWPCSMTQSPEKCQTTAVYYSNKYDHGVKLFLPNVVTCSNPKDSNTASF
jgi:hypothetical protein